VVKDETKRDDESFAKAKSDRESIVVFAVLSATAATAFAIQAWMTFGFGDEVWGLPTELSVALVFALDVFAIMFMVLTYLLRGTGWPRFAATLVFIFAIGAQVAAAEMFGEHRQWSTEVRWFSAIPAAFLALSQEGVILWRTYRGRAGRKDADRGVTTKRQVREVTTPAQRATGAAPVRPRPTRPDNAPPSPPPPGGRGRRERKRAEAAAEIERRDLAAMSVINGDRKVGEVAAEQRVSTRTVQNWMASFRERNPEVSEGAPGKPQVNDEKEVGADG
jgi:hypothetical protein